MNDLTYEVTFTYNVGDEFFTEKIEREVDIDWFENLKMTATHYWFALSPLIVETVPSSPVSPPMLTARMSTTFS